VRNDTSEAEAALRKPILGTLFGCCASTVEQGARSREHRARRMIFLVIAVRRAFPISDVPTVLCLLSSIASLDDFRTLFIQKLVAAIGTEKLDLFAPKLLVVAIKFAFTPRAGHPENLRHDSS